MKLKIYITESAGLTAEDESVSPALQRLLAAGQVRFVDEPLPVALCQEFGVQMQSDWPLAALSWLGEGNDPEQDYWLRADPVHLALQRDHFSLSGPVPLPLAPQQAELLAADLNRHFAADGLQFHLGRTESFSGTRWYLRLHAVPELSTFLPQQALGLDTRPFLPQGEDAQRWRRLLNEIEMLLHEHPVNQTREVEGSVAVNSLWLSAGGIIPHSLTSPCKWVCTDMPLATGLALATHTAINRVPADLDVQLDRAGGDGILVLEDAERAEQRWLAPLLSALRQRKLQQADLYFGMHNRSLAVRIHWYDLFRFWRRPRSLGTYFSA